MSGLRRRSFCSFWMWATVISREMISGPVQNTLISGSSSRRWWQVAFASVVALCHATGNTAWDRKGIGLRAALAGPLEHVVGDVALRQCKRTHRFWSSAAMRSGMSSKSRRNADTQGQHLLETLLEMFKVAGSLKRMSSPGLSA